MTVTQFVILLGTIWIAPHTNKWYALSVGSVCMLIATVRELIA